MANACSVRAVEQWLAAFQVALARGDAAEACELFVEDCFWRDIVAFTGDIRTLEGREAVRDLIRSSSLLRDGCVWSHGPTTALGADNNEGFVAFSSRLGRGQGYLRLKNGKCWTFLTRLESLNGHEERRGRNRPKGAVNDPVVSRANWRRSREDELAAMGRTIQPFVLIVGAGQAGLALGARLRQLDVPTLIVDRHPRVGDQWRSRYDSLSLHDPVWYDHLPYLPFPDTWPIFTPKDKLGDWLEGYANAMELLVWGSTECQSAIFNPAEKRWTVNLRRDGEPMAVRPAHLVLAIGNAGKPHRPSFPGERDFSGPVLHSSAYKSGEAFRGRRVVVIGSNNSAHDICADLVSHGAEATMIQRSSTHVVRSETVMQYMLANAYSEEALAAGITTDLADLLVASMPLRLQPDVYRPLHKAIAQIDADFYDRLEAVGFMHDFGEDGTGMPLKYLRRASGYYIDVGASDLIANGTIKLRSRVGIERFEANAVRLSDGSAVEADAIVLATGFGSMDQWAADLLSPDVANRVGKVWGYGSGTRGDPGPWEGELRNMWKPTAQEGLWFHGGNLAQSRFYSLALALQLKARQVAVPLEGVFKAER